MKKRSLKFKLIFGGVMAVVIPIIVVGLFAVNKSSTSLVASAKGQAEVAARNIAAMVDVTIAQEVKFAGGLALDPLVKDAANKVAEVGIDNSMTELKVLDNFLTNIVKKVGKDYNVLFITDSKGFFIADSNGGANRAKKTSVAGRGYFAAVKRTGKISIGSPVISKTSGKPIVVVAIPLKTVSGQFAGMFGVSLKLGALSEKITQEKIGKTGYPFMIDQKGLVISHPKKELIFELNLTQLKGMESISNQMVSQKSGVDNYTFKGIDKIAGFSPVKATGWSICVTQDQSEFMAPVRAIRNVVLGAGAIFLVITVLAVLWFARGITLPINRIIEGLGEGSNQVAAASSEVSSSSQSLAEGASEQAASIEETSSSMEEMASMTAKNSENAVHADNLMKDTNQVVIEANESMTQLTQSMEEISKASEETSKIIKTIDEIAFQTNLLALNAAVEAARAGEAGAGFAVVADEVRNLAMRAADAAKNTAELIEETVKKVNSGSELVSRTNDSFSKVAESSGKVGSLVAEISEASREQSEGIEQVNNAIGEMDKVVQQNAANAEESASASEEMNAQAEQLKTYVRDLVMVITGSRDGARRETSQTKVKRTVSNQPGVPTERKRIPQQSVGEVKPHQVIPFDDDDEFENF